MGAGPSTQLLNVYYEPVAGYWFPCIPTTVLGSHYRKDPYLGTPVARCACSGHCTETVCVSGVLPVSVPVVSRICVSVLGALRGLGPPSSLSRPLRHPLPHGHEGALQPRCHPSRGLRVPPQAPASQQGWSECTHPPPVPNPDQQVSAPLVGLKPWREHCPPGPKPPVQTACLGSHTCPHSPPDPPLSLAPAQPGANLGPEVLACMLPTWQSLLLVTPTAAFSERTPGHNQPCSPPPSP
ncbi:basic proline-rich protein-like [Zalophus californianus]|uniref:Basic proline-rich protein-like n=1 Tax=Zalophus californianus TaxID=9704 RepID=A0A6J2C5L8_ZALCA|nr:basic proline-rich protein-like [Zalophus californianus]